MPGWRPKLPRRWLLRVLRARRLAGRTAGELTHRAQRAELTFLMIAAVVIGLLAGGGAIAFRHLIRASEGAFFFSLDHGIESVAALPWYLKLLIPAVGGLLVGPIIAYLAPETRGSGVPEVMEAAALKGGVLRARVVVLKSLAAALTIGSGGSAGREGPIIHIGSALGSVLGQFISVSPRHMRTFVACGAAAGIAATFNAPIAGALFAVEVLLGEFAVLQFSPIVISSVTAVVLSRHYLGDSPAFAVPQYELLSASEFLPYAVLGVAAGLLAAAFISMVYGTQDLMRALPVPTWVRPAIGGLVVGAIAIALPQVFGVGYGALDDALWGKTALGLLVLLIPAKMLATSATLGSGGSGGIFAPSLFVGAMLGGAVGYVAGIWMPGIASPGAYALVGMGAMVAGTTFGPISAILIIFELTGDYLIIPPLMVACILSVLLSSWLQPHSMYTTKLAKRGINLAASKDVNILRSLAVEDVLDPSPARIPASSTVHEVLDRMLHSARGDFFVVDPDGRLIGALTLLDMRELINRADLPDDLVARDMAHTQPPTVRPKANLDLVMHLFGQHDEDEIAVVDRGGLLLGSVRRKHVIEAYNREIFQRDLSGGFHSVMSGVEPEHDVELLGGHCLVEVPTPFAFVGKTLRQLRVRARYDVEIILIRKPEGDQGDIDRRPGAFPHADYSMEAGDTLLVLGSREDIRRFRDALPPHPPRRSSEDSG
jgi:chloride channel protein, CIC family